MKLDNYIETCGTQSFVSKTLGDITICNCSIPNVVITNVAITECGIINYSTFIQWFSV